MLDSFQEAIDELTWRYGTTASALGIRAQAYDGVGGKVDAAAIGRMIDARLTDGHRGAIHRAERIDRTLAMLDASSQAVLRLAFEPYGRSVSARLSAVLTVGKVDLAGVFVWRVCLVGIVVGSHSARVAFARGGSTLVAPSLEEMQKFLESAAGARANGPMLDRLKTDAIDVLIGPLARYDSARRERVTREGDDKRARDLEIRAAVEQEKTEREADDHDRHVAQVAALVAVLAARRSEAPDAIVQREAAE